MTTTASKLKKIKTSITNKYKLDEQLVSNIIDDYIQQSQSSKKKKRKCTGYNIFMKEKCKSVTMEGGEKASDRFKKVSLLWKVLSPEGKVIYNKKAKDYNDSTESEEKVNVELKEEPKPNTEPVVKKEQVVSEPVVSEPVVSEPVVKPHKKKTKKSKSKK